MAAWCRTQTHPLDCVESIETLLILGDGNVEFSSQLGQSKQDHTRQATFAPDPVLECLLATWRLDSNRAKKGSKNQGVWEEAIVDLMKDHFLHTHLWVPVPRHHPGSWRGGRRRLVLKSRSHLQQLGEKQVIDACAGRCATSTGNAKPRHRPGGHRSKEG
ncbi:hypothetical protein BKA80DRAFT_137742 [Phyllosticta citrichinensis]